MSYCAQCKLNLPEGSKFCRACGREVIESQPAQLQCRRCGAETQPDWITCIRCGYSLESAPPTVKMSPALTCMKCGATLNEGMRYCLGCGADQTSGQAGKSTTPESEGAQGVRLATTVIERAVTLPELPAQPGLACRKCGSFIQPGKKFCEKCGAPVAVQTVRPALEKNRKALFITSGAAVALILLLAGWYFWGVSITIITNQPGAQVLVDDALVASSADSSGRVIASHVLRGARTIRVKCEGFEDSVMSVTLGPGDFAKTIEVKLSPYRFSLTLSSEPAGCKVLVDGKEAGATDSAGKFTLKEIARGNHMLTLQHAGYQDWTQSISLTSSQSIRAELVLAVGGIWQGSFTASKAIPLAFTLDIEQTAAPFKGKADQRDANNSVSNATLEGTVSGSEIRYVKRYSNGGESNYRGNVDATGKRASGTWTSGSASGTWVMAKVDKADAGWIAPISNKIDSFDAKVTDLKFYEAGSEEPAQRKYSASFKGASSRYINYELDLQYSAPGRRIDFETKAVFYNADGTVLGERTRQAHVEPEWNQSNHYDGWGSNTPGTWKTGFYRVDIFVGGNRIASKWFEIN